MRALEELRDPWAIALAEATAFSAYIFGGREWQIAAAPVAVLAVRVVTGLLMPVSPIVPTPELTPDEYVVARLIAQGRSNAQIGRRMKISERAVDLHESRIVTKIGGQRRDIAKWVGTPAADPLPRHWFERTLVRGTLSGAGLISLVWTLYNIVKTFWPQILGR
ncbi:MAG: helix-turn-helix transcriptional regulator [Chloroflexi bacterium]|nr:MAG: helix-turn-helix transcriptional regulator [Chloroflexota bacterium]